MARPPLPPQEKLAKRINVAVTETEHAELLARAGAEDLTLSHWGRRVLRQALAARRKPPKK